jgi:transmembrane sensor
MKRPRASDLRIAEEAARWQGALERADGETHAEFSSWVKASPSHLREFLFMEALRSVARESAPGKPVELADFPMDDGNVSHLRPQRDRTPAAAPMLRWELAAAATVAIALTGTAWWASGLRPGAATSYTTETGEQRSIRLEDGSVVQLNTGSSARIRMSEDARDIELLRGAALFKGAQDPGRPFRVRAGNATIRALGTQFNVHRRVGDIAVTVVEGRVEVAGASAMDSGKSHGSGTSALQLGAGEAGSVGADGAITKESAADVPEALAWQQRRLVFRDEHLDVIAAEFNRYNARPHLVVEGEAVRTLRFGGTFDADNPQSLVNFVLRSGELEAVRRDDRIVIRQRLD